MLLSNISVEICQLGFILVIFGKHYLHVHIQLNCCKSMISLPSDVTAVIIIYKMTILTQHSR